jgi:hypothetical protein
VSVNASRLYFTSGDILAFDFGGSAANTISTSAVFRDPSAWYHIVLSIDTTQATAANRIGIYVNGVQQTTTGTPVAQNTDTLFWVSANNALIGVRSGTDYFNGYITEINVVNGQALTPSSFGLNDPETGIWSPRAYTGTYGANGFYLNFSDNSASPPTATTLGKDYSGNGNNWTPNGLVTAAGAGNDSLVDTPTSYGSDTGVGGEVRGNYATLNPLAAPTGFSITASNGNLDVVFANSTYAKSIGSTLGLSSGKWYFEGTVNSGASVSFIGIEPSNTTIFSDTVSASRVIGYSSTGYGYYSTGDKRNNNTDAAYGNSYTTGDVIGVAIDLDNGKIWFSKNNTWQASGNPAAGTNPAFSSISAGTYIPGVTAYNSQGWTLNFGQRPFAYTAPSGFKALCTQNLPTPTIGATSTTQANKYFDATLYTGTGSVLTVTNAGGFRPDFVWVKSRSAATNNVLGNTQVANGNILISNSTAAEAFSPGLYDIGYIGGINGFTVQNYDGWTDTNGATYVAWQWRASNAAGVTNTSGSITSTVSANTTAGFSIATYTGNGSGGATVGHGLGASPAMIFIKSRSNATNWMVWHQNLTANYAFEGLNTTGAEVSGGSPSKYVRSVSSTLVTIGNDISVNQSASYTYVMYCFAAVAGYSAFGSYTGNGSANGPFVYTGFRPAFIMIKNAGATGSWCMFDARRNPSNGANLQLQANSSSAEGTFTVAEAPDLLSNGFKLNFSYSDFNSSGVQYIYAAFAESPFKYALAR